MKTRRTGAAASLLRTKTAVPRQDAEEIEHRAVVEHLQWRAVRDVVWAHPANGGRRSKAEAGRLKAMGVVAGMPDLLLWHGGKSYVLELKSRGGRVSHAQRETLARLDAAGVYTAVAYGADEAVRQLQAWGLLR